VECQSEFQLAQKFGVGVFFDQSMKETRQALKNILPYLKPHKLRIFVLLFLVLLSTGLVISQPYLTSYIIDNLIAKLKMEGVQFWLFLLLGCYIFQGITSYISTTLVGQISQTIVASVRNDLFAKIQKLPMQFFLANKSGDIISRLNNDTRKLDNFLSQYIFEFISSFFTFLGIGLFIFTQNVSLAFVSWAMIVILVFFSIIVGPIITRNSKKQLESGSLITSFLNENITNYKAVSAFNQQQNLNSQFKGLIDNYYQRSLKVKLLTGVFRPIYNFAGLISYALVMMFGLYQVSLGNLTVGLVIGFLLYVQKFYEPINRLAAVYSSFQQALGAWSRITEVLELDPEAMDLTLTKPSGSLEKDYME
jgi:ATP-binding cassette, subfamily B, bacterial